MLGSQACPTNFTLEMPFNILFSFFINIIFHPQKVIKHQQKEMVSFFSCLEHQREGRLWVSGVPKGPFCFQAMTLHGPASYVFLCCERKGLMSCSKAEEAPRYWTVSACVNLLYSCRSADTSSPPEHSPFRARGWSGVFSPHHKSRKTSSQFL